MGVAAERMAHQDDVVAPGREGAVGLVRHANRVQVTAAVEPDWLRQVEVLRFDRAYTAGRAGAADGPASPAASVEAGSAMAAILAGPGGRIV